VFEPREVVAGWHSGERVQILKGVQPGERVVVGATFLVDSESRLKAPDASATPAYPGSSQRASVVAGRGDAPEMVKDPSCGMSIDRAKAEAAGNTVSVHGETYYFCSTK